jgi:hypothetical protein
MKHLKHVEHTLATCTNSVTHHECLLVAVTACPLPQAIPLLLSAEGAAGASHRHELCARAPPPPHIEKKGRRRPWAAAAHPAVGGARWRIWLWGRAPLPEESLPAPVVAGGGALFAGEEEKRKREKWWAVDSFFRGGERNV